jgi:hypothetical protein
MTKPNYTHIHMLFDRSGSMAGHESDIDGWYKTFINGQREIPGDCTISSAQFDTGGYEIVTEWSKIQDAPQEFKLRPRGGTPLLDSVARSINDLGERLSKMSEEDRPSKVLIVIQTDGEENSSLEYTVEKLRALVERQQKEYSWQFMFLGADIDAYSDAGGIGIARGSTMSFGNNTQGYSISGRVSTAAVGRWRTTTNNNLSYTVQEQEDAESTKSNP